MFLCPLSLDRDSGFQILLTRKLGCDTLSIRAGVTGQTIGIREAVDEKQALRSVVVDPG